MEERGGTILIRERGRRREGATQLQSCRGRLAASGRKRGGKEWGRGRAAAFPPLPPFQRAYLHLSSPPFGSTAQHCGTVDDRLLPLLSSFHSTLPSPPATGGEERREAASASRKIDPSSSSSSSDRPSPSEIQHTQVVAGDNVSRSNATISEKTAESLLLSKSLWKIHPRGENEGKLRCDKRLFLFFEKNHLCPKVKRGRRTCILERALSPYPVKAVKG